MKIPFRSSRNAFHAAAVAGLLAFGAAAPAHALTATVNAGPVLLPAATSVRVCIDTTCIDTTNLDVVTMGVSVTVDRLLGVLPIILPAFCPSGQTGVALLVNANTKNTKIKLNVSGKVAGSVLTLNEPLGPIVLPLNRSVTVSACAL